MPVINGTRDVVEAGTASLQWRHPSWPPCITIASLGGKALLLLVKVTLLDTLEQWSITLGLTRDREGRAKV